jgi:transposase InsO family protein
MYVVLDLYSRRVVGWSMATNWARGLAFHSDRGVQYCADAFRSRARACGMQQSMSRKGYCCDNACAESFFESLKTELMGR